MSTLLSTSIPNLINGVSQQPAALRLPSQCEEQINGYSSVVEGLRKRPPTRHRAKITGLPAGDLFVHTINRDLDEQYTVLIGNGSIKVFDMEGNEQTVNAPSGLTYLNTSTPSDHMRAVTVADYTFILNRNVTVASLGTLVTTRRPEALIWVRQGAYGSAYNIWVNGHSASFTTPDGSDPSHVNQLKTDHIAGQLMTQLQASPGFTTAFDITQTGSSIHIQSKTTAEFTVSYGDSQGDQAMKLVKGKVQRFGDLPARAVPGIKVEITGDQTSAFDNYYVEFVEAPGNTHNGVWTEAVKSGERFRLNATTLPHALIREANGTFTFKPLDWAERKAGDSDSNPFPSFVGRKINDIFFHRNRLGLAADENVVFSRAGDFFNFFRSSATQVIDTDPIDVAVSHTKVSVINHAVPFNETLLLFSGQTQFMLGAAELLTPQTISINQTTEFECSLRAKPVGAGKNVFFATNKGEWTGIREYYVDGDTQTNDAADITAHVPKYIPGNIVKLAASSNEDVLVALSGNRRNELYVYKFYWSIDEKLQSSWSRWSFPETDTILSVDFIESDLWLVVRRADGVYLESVSLDPGRVDTDLGFKAHLDQRVTEDDCTVVYDSDTNTTTITPPYTLEADETYEVLSRQSTGGYKAGELLRATRAGNTLTVPGDLQSFYLGRRYEFRYRFSTFVIKEEATGGGLVAVGEGRLQLRNASVAYDRSGYFRVEVTSIGRPTYRYVFNGRVIGSAENRIGYPALETGRFKFPVMSKNDQVTIEVVNETHMPCSFLSAEWEGMYTVRSRRL